MLLGNGCDLNEAKYGKEYLVQNADVTELDFLSRI